MKKYSLFLLFFFTFTTSIFAQDTVDYIDEIKMKNGNVFLGKMIEFNENTIVMDVRGGFRISFNQKDVERIRQKFLQKNGEIIIGTPEELGEKLKDSYTLRLNQNGKITLLKRNNFREKGTYGSASLNYSRTSFGRFYAYNTFASFNFSGGYLFSRKLGVGLGAGANLYSTGTITYPIFVEVKSFLTNKRRSPYVSFKSGYGLLSKKITDNSINRTGQTISSYKGGLFMNPAVGVRLTSNEDLNLVMEAGLNSQKTEINYFLLSNNTGVKSRTEIYRKIYLGIGIIF